MRTTAAVDEQTAATRTIDFDAAGFVWLNAGDHGGETLSEIIARKRRDIDEFGWCLWAYSGGGGPLHPEHQIRKLADQIGDEIAVVMRNTGKFDPGGVPFTGYSLSRSGPRVALPPGMSPVTGAPGAWALMLSEIDWTPGMVVDVNRYAAPFAAAGAQPLSDYLKGSHGRACAVRTELAGATPSPRTLDAIGRLRAPHAVYMLV